jgi:hypothetical protein
MSRPCPCFCLPAVITVANPSTVVYRCPRGASTWSPRTFALELVALAGQAGCRQQGQQSTTVTVTRKPTVTVTPLNSPVLVSPNSPYVDVGFTVQSAGNTLSVPATVTASNGQATTTCSIQSPGSNTGCECPGQQ